MSEYSVLSDYRGTFVCTQWGQVFQNTLHMCAALITFHPSWCKSLEDFTTGDCHLQETFEQEIAISMKPVNS